MKKIGVLIIALWATFIIWDGKTIAQPNTKGFLTEYLIQIGNEASEYEEMGMYDEALQKYNQVCKKYPDSYDCLVSKNCIAEMYYKIGKIKEANQIIEEQIARCDREIKQGGESYYSALRLIAKSINYKSKRRYDVSLSEDERIELSEKANQQLETILKYRKCDFKGTEDEFQWVQNFARYRVAEFMIDKRDFKKAEELLSQMPEDTKYGVVYIGEFLVDEYAKKGNWKKVADLVSKYRGRGKILDISVNDSFCYQAQRRKEAGKITEALEMLKSLPEPNDKVQRLISDWEGELRGERPSRAANTKADEELYLKFSKARKLNQESVMAFDEGKGDLAWEKVKAAQTIIDEANKLKNKSPDWYPEEIKALYNNIEKEIQKNLILIRKNGKLR